MVIVLADAIDRLTVDQLQELLRKLGNPLFRIADRRHSMTRLADTLEHRKSCKPFRGRNCF